MAESAGGPGLLPLGLRRHVPDLRDKRDVLIGATALAHGMAVVTRGVADFEPTGVATVNLWHDTV